ncbi:MAG TPA: VanZ family protein [Thermoanaerobaculia bacterium]|nr:VanZ family protein [Thermoanaerobaculia bacterium]
MQTTIVVKRPVTILLLLVATAAIAAATLWLSGKSYSKIDPIPFEDLRHLAHRIAHRPVSTRVLSLIVVPIIANVLLFVPWGFLMFIALHNITRPTVQTYVLTFLLGLTFACAVEAWQYFLPTRVADINDIIWNSTGTLLGAFLAHLRLRLRFEFD